MNARLLAASVCMGKESNKQKHENRSAVYRVNKTEIVYVKLC